jgi:hypothetical protein
MISEFVEVMESKDSFAKPVCANFKTGAVIRKSIGAHGPRTIGVDFRVLGMAVVTVVEYELEAPMQTVWLSTLDQFWCKSEGWVISVLNAF